MFVASCWISARRVLVGIVAAASTGILAVVAGYSPADQPGTNAPGSWSTPVVAESGIPNADVAREPRDPKSAVAQHRRQVADARVAERQPEPTQTTATPQPPVSDQPVSPVPVPPDPPAYVKPAEGRFTSGFGARWGGRHFGIDIANVIGTPIRAVAAGEVIEAGPARGFGLWVRIRHDDGTITVYGHVNTITTSRNQRVQGGQQIATMGNRGQSTGPHLHFEVWLGGHRKVNPVPWLGARGIRL